MGRAGFTAVSVALFLAACPGTAAARSAAERQWHLDELGVPAVHRVVRGDGVVVAVVDSGVDDTVPDLAGALLPGAGFGSAEGSDGTEDATGHGTAMAALIAGRGVAGGVLGVAPAARVLPVSVGAGGGNFTTAAVAEGITWAVDHGADVLNVSLTSTAPTTPDLLRAVAHALDHDVVVVAGTGNEGVGRVGAPAGVEGVVAVSGTVPGGAPWPSSNTGPETVLAAPAEGIRTALPRSVAASGFAAVDGTSAATALVSGVAALVRARHPDLDAGNVVHRLVTTATDLGPVGRDDATGFGLVAPGPAVLGEVARVDRNPLLPPTTTVPPPTRPAPTRPEGDRRAGGDPAGDGGVRAAVALGGAVALGAVALGAVVVAVLCGRRARRAADRADGPPDECRKG
ncbi:S8 family serine peptidase [Saccharothrix australiensis]|uniref:Subtilisin family serine protease n=1 Tax=Saccharothrix australiensis TaxID=2072 RepID=A0A495VR54_9PSEU|nr:S8 family serine peptidase [Saccharothrix australiensis]RKT51744.1 subtilisin family serine protease [Saccharothrix australiensis]